MGKYGTYSLIDAGSVTDLTDVELLAKDSTGAGTATVRINLAQVQDLVGIDALTEGDNISIAAGEVATVAVPTFTNVTYGVYTITDGGSVDINPANGAIQVWTLGDNRTPTASSFATGQAVTLMINDGTAYSVTWSTIGVVWVGGTAPTLPTSGYGVVELWKVGSTVYGASVGNVA